MPSEKTILITGGAGFIGSHLVRRMVKRYPQYEIINFDKLTYAGNLANLSDIENAPNYYFVKGDITVPEDLEQVFGEKSPDGVIHLAAESHVDRSIENPLAFIDTNIRGTANLLHVCRKYWQTETSAAFAAKEKRFVHVSTDEVFGSLGKEGYFNEATAYDPRSPYSSSKAASDHLVRAWFHTYGLPTVITNCSNNYGSHQFPEKLIPLMIRNIIKGNEPLPVYGQGLNVRDWLLVDDHVEALDLAFHKGQPGATYCIGGDNEWRNIDLVKKLCEIMDELLERRPGTSAEQITFVKDRAGHDMRYAIDASKAKADLGWKPSVDFETGLQKTAAWYLNNQSWLNEVTSGAYLEYYDRHYTHR